MNKMSLLALTPCIFLQTLFAQNVQDRNTYADALELARIYQIDKNADSSKNHNYLHESFIRILAKYDSEYNKYIRSQDKCDLNPFFTGFIPLYIAKGIRTIIPYEPNTYYTKSVGTGNWQAEAIGGLSTFMAKRFQAEVLSMGLNQVFKKIINNDSALINELLPKTFKEIKTLYDNGYYYSADLVYLRQVVEEDLEELPKQFIQNGNLFQISADQRDYMRAFYSVIISCKTGFTLPDILNKLSEQPYKDSKNVELFKLIKTVETSLRDVEGSTAMWVGVARLSPEEISDLNKIEVRFFYGLLYEQLRQTSFFKSLGQTTDDITKDAEKMSELVSAISKMNDLYKFAKDRSFKFTTIEELFAYSIEINHTLINFYKTGLVDSVVNFDFVKEEILHKYENILQPLLVKDYKKAIPLVLTEFKNYLPDGIKNNRSAVFLSQLITIESDDDMEKLLESYALPIGGSSIKRHSNFNISVNGYVGGTCGYEYAHGSLAEQEKKNFGLTAPIGVSVTICGWLTGFISVIDFGSMVNERIGNDTASYSNLRFDQFLAPGVGLYINCPSLPISVGLHYCSIQNLRTIKYENNNAVITETNVSVTRWNLSILIDIPFFTLYNSPK